MANLIANIKQRFIDASGVPLVGGKLYSYAAGTSTPLATYVDQSEVTPNTNPIILDANGEADIWVGDNSYKFVLKDASNVTLWTVDNVSNVAAGSITTAKLADGSVTTPKLADAAVTSVKILDNAIIASKVPTGSIVTSKLADDAVTTIKILDANVTTPKLANDAVTTVKILDSNVTTPKIAASAVTIAKTPILGLSTNTISNSSTSSSTYATIASGSFTTTGASLYGMFYSNNIGSQPDGYLKLSGSSFASSGNVQATIRGYLTLELTTGGFTYYFENVVGFDWLAPAAADLTQSQIYPPGSLALNIGSFAAGTYSYTLKWKVVATGTGVTPQLSSNGLFFKVYEDFVRYV